jgi:uncharacterized protein (TIGR00251 family)
MSLPCLRPSAKGDGTFLSVKLQPRASRNEIQGLHGAELKISVTAPPVDSAANAALIEFLAETLNLHRSALQLIRGQTSRHKTIFITGLSPAQLAGRLPH